MKEIIEIIRECSPITIGEVKEGDFIIFKVSSLCYFFGIVCSVFYEEGTFYFKGITKDKEIFNCIFEDSEVSYFKCNHPIYIITNE
ncbi:MAG: hypothetical protein ACW98X_21945 [Promethearchaeota archaeon]|jgi:hypothetical protein